MGRELDLLLLRLFGVEYVENDFIDVFGDMKRPYQIC